MGEALPERMAWRVRLNDFCGVIIFAKSGAQARWIAVREWRDAGYGARKEWPTSLIARRAESYDNSSWRTRPQAAFSEFHVPLS